MWWHTVMHWRGIEGETGEWSGQPVLFTLPRNMVYPALLPLIRTPRLPAVDWNWRPRRFKWTRPFRRKTKSGFCACAITFQTQSTIKILFLEPRVCECLNGSVTRRKGKIFSGPEHYFIKKCKGAEVRGLLQVGLLYPWGKAPGLPWIRDRVGLAVCLSVGVC